MIYKGYDVIELVKGANAEEVKVLQELVLKHGNAEDYYKFVKTVKGADIKALCDAFVKSNNEEFCYYFAKNIKGADVKALGDVVIKSKNLVLCRAFAEKVEGADIKAFETLVGYKYYNKEKDPLDAKGAIKTVIKSFKENPEERYHHKAMPNQLTGERCVRSHNPFAKCSDIEL